MLTVDVKVNGRRIGGAKIVNTSDLAALSNYRVEVVEGGSAETGLPDFHAMLEVPDHARRQSVWALIEKVARQAAIAQQGRQAVADARREEVCPVCDGGPGNDGSCLCAAGRSL